MLSAKLVVTQWVPMCSCLTVLPAAIATCGRGRDMADGTVREIFHDRTDRHDWDFGGTAVATHFRHGDVSNPGYAVGAQAYSV